MTDEQHRLAGVVQLPLQPAFGRDVEEVVGLVQHEDVELAAQEGFERESLLFAAAQGSQRPVTNGVERFTERPGDAFVPRDFQLVATGIAPCGQRFGVLHRFRGQLWFGCGQPTSGDLQPFRGDRHQQLVHGGRRVVGGADELVHHADLAVDADRSLAGGQVAGDQFEQRRLADAVGADDRHPFAVTDPEPDVAEQLVTTG